jgi:hypothetical protein
VAGTGTTVPHETAATGHCRAAVFVYVQRAGHGVPTGGEMLSEMKAYAHLKPGQNGTKAPSPLQG